MRASLPAILRLTAKHKYCPPLPTQVFSLSFLCLHPINFLYSSCFFDQTNFPFPIPIQCQAGRPDPLSPLKPSTTVLTFRPTDHFLSQRFKRVRAKASNFQVSVTPTSTPSTQVAVAASKPNQGVPLDPSPAIKCHLKPAILQTL